MPAPAPNIFTHALAWLGTLLAHLRARLELAGIEGREAALHYGVIAALAAGGLVLVVFGYFFLCIAAVFLIALAFGGNAWPWVLLGMGVLHLLLGAALAFIAKTRLSKAMFSATLGELRKDHEWLTSTTANRH